MIQPSALTSYANAKQSTINLVGHFCAESQLQQTKDFLSNAVKNGMRVYVGLSCGSSPTMATASVEKVVKDLLVDKPGAIPPYTGAKAIAGWYIGDEPELTNVDPAVMKPYYDALVRADPSGTANVPAHPAFISFNMWYYFDSRDWGKARQFFPYLNTVGMHNYPFWTMHGEFGGNDARTQYDKWKQAYEDAKANGKDFIATAQGFGTGFGEPYRNPTYNELRYQVFSAVVLGIDKVLFWIELIRDPGRDADAGQPDGAADAVDRRGDECWRNVQQ